MPLYEYVCNDCDRRFDRLVRSLNSSELVNCESCASENIRRVASTFAAVGGLDDPITPMQTSSGGGCCGGSCGCGH